MSLSPTVRQLPQNSSALITSESRGIASYGAGLVVGREDQQSWVLTCAHVVPRGATCQVAGVTVNNLQDGAGAQQIHYCPVDNIDLALMKVSGLDMPPARIQGFPEDLRLGPSGTVLSYYAYDLLHGTHYMKSAVDIRVHRYVEIFTQSARNGVVGYEFEAIGDGKILPGHSGAAILNPFGRPAALAVFRLSASGRGLAIGLSNLKQIWPEFARVTEISEDEAPVRVLSPGGAPVTRSKPEAASTRVSVPPPPPPEPNPVDPEDLNKGRFGGADERDGLRIYGYFRDQATTKSYFVHDLIIERLDSQPVQGPARFVLHETFKPPEFIIKNTDERGRLVLSEITAYGIYTAGALIRNSNNEWIKLEYDLRKMPGLPERFLVF